MRVVAFSCVHWMTRELQINVYEYEQPLDYTPFIELCNRLMNNPPDVIVNLGDFTETYYETPPFLPKEYKELYEKHSGKFIKLRGNHDRDEGFDTINFDGIRYEHGHKLTRPGDDASVEGYIAELRNSTEGIKLVHGHTHVPYISPSGLLDVGSVTFSRSYGEMIDGVPKLMYL